ncbi:GTP-binding protein, partial [Escherichia coli]
PDVPPERLLGGLFGLDGRGTSKSEDVRAWLGAEEPDHHHGHHHHDDHHPHHGPHHHDVNRHDAAIRAFHLISEAPVPRPAFEM